MPIKPENKARYPKDWKQIRDRVVQRAGNKCEFCGVRNGELGARRKGDRKFFKAYPLGEKMLRLEWPKPGDRCTEGTTRFRARITAVGGFRNGEARMGISRKTNTDLTARPG